MCARNWSKRHIVVLNTCEKDILPHVRIRLQMRHPYEVLIQVAVADKRAFGGKKIEYNPLCKMLYFPNSLQADITQFE